MSEVCHDPFSTLFVLFVDSASEGLPERVFSTFPLSPHIGLHVQGEKESTEPLSFYLDRYNSPGYSIFMSTKKNPSLEEMAAIARMTLNGSMPSVDSKGKRLPLRYYAALREVEARKGGK